MTIDAPRCPAMHPDLPYSRCGREEGHGLLHKTFTGLEWDDTMHPDGRLTWHHDDADGGVIAAAIETEAEGDAAFWRARTEKAERGAKTLGKIVEDQCRDIARITRSEHMVDAAGDADWGAIWERGHDMAQRLHDAEARIDKLRAEQTRPLSPDDITDEARERAHRAVAALSVSDWDDLSGVAKGRAMALVEAVITEVTRPEPPARPEGAEELETVIGLNAGAWTAGPEDVRALADLLASNGVRVTGAES